MTWDPEIETAAAGIEHLLRLVAPEKRAAVLAKAIAAEKWLAGRKEAGKAIDVATCEIGIWGVQMLDPYGVHERFPFDGFEHLRPLPRKRRLDHAGRLAGRKRALHQRMDREGYTRRDDDIPF
jgi:hypothetical protein